MKTVRMERPANPLAYAIRLGLTGTLLLAIGGTALAQEPPDADEAAKKGSSGSRVGDLGLLRGV